MVQGGYASHTNALHNAVTLQNNSLHVMSRHVDTRSSARDIDYTSLSQWQTLSTQGLNPGKMSSQRVYVFNRDDRKGWIESLVSQ